MAEPEVTDRADVAADPAVPPLPPGLMGEAIVVFAAEKMTVRPWGNEGEATVTSLEVHLSDGRRLSMIRKRGRVPKARGKRSAKAAENKLASFAAEAAFLRDAGPRIGAACPAALHVHQHEHFQQNGSRQFDMLMSDLRMDGFPRQEAALDVADTIAALRWLGHLHAEFWPSASDSSIGSDGTTVLPHRRLVDADVRLIEGLWPVGTYWNMAKRGEEATQQRMAAHWRTARAELPGLHELRPDFASRLCAAAAAVDEALHPCEVELEHAEQASMSRSTRRRAPVSPRASSFSRVRRTVVHGDFKAENVSGATSGCYEREFHSRRCSSSRVGHLTPGPLRRSSSLRRVKPARSRGVRRATSSGRGAPLGPWTWSTYSPPAWRHACSMSTSAHYSWRTTTRSRSA